MTKPSKTYTFGLARANVYTDRLNAGAAAAQAASDLICDAVDRHGRARIIVATGNSQLNTIDALSAMHDVPWDHVEAFHMDEYIGISKDHPSSFRHWLKVHLASKQDLADMHYIHGDAPDIDREIIRYSELLESGPIDLAFVGIGENGHIAFNEPEIADFNDPKTMKIVELEKASLLQQVGEGHFENIDMVPNSAITITCSGLLKANHWICCVPEKRKAKAVSEALKGEISTSCPGSIVQSKPNTTLFLDPDSAAFLP